MYRTIRADKVVDTASSLRARVHARFPESGLLRVADELLVAARESQERCRWIASPNVPLRVGAWFLVVDVLTPCQESLGRFHVSLGHAS
jgi:hypothetical protein